MLARREGNNFSGKKKHHLTHTNLATYRPPCKTTTQRHNCAQQNLSGCELFAAPRPARRSVPRKRSRSVHTSFPLFLCCNFKLFDTVPVVCGMVNSTMCLSIRCCTHSLGTNETTTISSAICGTPKFARRSTALVWNKPHHLDGLPDCSLIHRSKRTTVTTSIVSAKI